MIRARTCATFLALGLMIAFAWASESSAQSFPYSVPKAPEFGSSSGDREAREPAPQLKRRSRRSRPPSSRASAQRGPRNTPRYPSAAAPQNYAAQQAPAVGPTRSRATGPVPPPVQQSTTPPQQLDCSQFPILIANSKNETEMRWHARLFLTCLIKNGWNEAQAKNHVVQAIRSYEMTRMR